MPASVADPVALVLRTALSGKKGPYSQDVENGPELLEDRLAASAKRVLLSNIDYELAPKQQVVSMDSLKTKYTVLSASHSSKTVAVNGASPVSNHETLPPPKITLFRSEDVKVGWKSSVPVGSGMVNMGNTCYMNSTLQALFHVPSLSNWLLSGRPCKSCDPNGNQMCVVCVIAKTLKSTHEKSGSVVKPILVYNRLKLICKHLVHGRQEDAHEFMRYLVEAMEKAYLQSIGGTKLDSRSKETNPLGQIFGGYIRTEVTCLKCKNISTTFQHFQDIPLDIQHASTLDDALSYYFRRERLEGDNAYKCEKCKCKVPATKKFSVERAPNVLCIQLKRFGLMGGKMSKHVQFSRTLNLNRFLFHQSPGTCSAYKFVSLINHMGPSQHCGHYTAIAEASNGQLYLFDDCSVRLISLNVALNTGAYVLIYEKIQSTPSPCANVVAKSSDKAQTAQLSNGVSKLTEKAASPVNSSSNGTHKPSEKGHFTPIPSSNGIPKIQGDSQKNLNGKVKAPENRPAMISEPPRSKISIELKKPENLVQQKPRLVIRNGATSLFKSANPIATTSNGNATKTDTQTTPAPANKPLKNLTALVPYDSESSDEENDKEKPATASITNGIGGTAAVKSTENKWQVSPSPTNAESTQAVSTIDSSSARWQVLDNTQQDNSSNSTTGSGCSGSKWVVRSLSDTETEKSAPPNKRQKTSHSDTEMDPPAKPTPAFKKIGEKIRQLGDKIFGTSSKAPEQPEVKIDKKSEVKPEAKSEAKPEIKPETKTEVEEKPQSRDSMKDSQQADTSQSSAEANGSLCAVSSSNEKTEKSVMKWDGSRNNDTVKELLRMSHSGFSDQVRTWDGGKSHLTKQVEDDKRLQRKRTADELYDEEFDKGKVKKVKSKDNSRESSPSHSGYNPFQAFQNRQREQQHNNHQNHHKNDQFKKNHFHSNNRHSYRGGKGKGHRNDYHKPHSQNQSWRRFR